MSVDIKVNIDLSLLEDLKKSFSGKNIVKVGVLAGDSSRDDELTNAEIGLKHEFGSVSENIPPRSFLRMPLEAKKQDLVKTLETKKAKKAITEGDLDSALELMGVAAEGIIQEAFSTRGFGEWQENSPATIAKKKSSSPLIDTGQLRRSISSEVVNG